jgi:UDP-glucuronate 4-epimerase
MRLIIILKLGGRIRMKILVTGSSGFIGSHLCKKLRDDGHWVFEWDSVIDKKVEDLTFDELVNSEMVNSEMEKAFKITITDVTAIIHLAARADVRASFKDPQAYWKNNVEPTTKLQQLCSDIGIPLIYASSSCAKKWWMSPYGTTKKVNEETAHEGQVGLRFTTVYGDQLVPGARETMLIERLKSGNIKYVTRHIRDFVFVKDVVDVIIGIMEKLIENKKLEIDAPFDMIKILPIYDVGTGKGVIVEELAKIAKYNLPVQSGDECEAPENVADVSALKELLGFVPKHRVEDYVETMVE